MLPRTCSVTAQMRCDQCNKFVSYDEPQAEVLSVEIDGDSVRAQVNVLLHCQDCGQTLKDCEIESETQIDHVCTKPKLPDWKQGKDDQYECENEGEASGESRRQSHDRNGKPILRARYQRTYYGFTLESDIRCCRCGEVFGIELKGEEQASAFNECI